MDRELRKGLSPFREGFRRAHGEYAASRQHSDGGFAGRLGGSDLYYTDFAVRVLSLLAPAHRALEAARRHVERIQVPPGSSDVVECFNLLHLRRNLCLGPPPGPAAEAILGTLRGSVLPGGGLSGGRGSDRLSAYGTFLGLLCFQMLAIPLPGKSLLRNALEGLSCADGGYAEGPGQASGQVNSTAAAVAALVLLGALPSRRIPAIAGFLAGLQMPDGGLAAHASAGQGDLLSTFTGLATLWFLKAARRIDLAAAGRFLQQAAAEGGGFRACADDREADVEYTFYGIGTAALLRRCADGAGPPGLLRAGTAAAIHAVLERLRALLRS